MHMEQEILEHHHQNLNGSDWIAMHRADMAHDPARDTEMMMTDNTVHIQDRLDHNGKAVVGTAVINRGNGAI